MFRGSVGGRAPGRQGCSVVDRVMFTIWWLLASVLAEWGVRALIHRGVYYYTASSQAQDGERAVAFILTVLTPVFTFVVVMLIYNFIRFSTARGVATPGPHQFQTNKTFIGMWVLISIGLNVLFFVHPSASALEQMFNSEQQRVHRQDLVVNVVARQWQWIFSYPQYGVEDAEDANGNSTLYLPVNRNVKFILRSYDPYHTYAPEAAVVHDFWIPAFGLKQDIIPGETRYMYVHTTKVTSYNVNPMVRVQCAEVCGPGHPFMEAPVHVVSGVDFVAWVRQQRMRQAQS